MALYALTIFTGAFLLFQVQPVIARIILPWFGGSAAVWTTCMLFFQTVLVLGYLYAHQVTRRLSLRRQAVLHAVLLLAAVLTLPILPGEGWKPRGAENPIGNILALLAGTVGLPYLMLATTGPLLQAWYVRAREGAVPYRLFALSNLGSMLALLTYPPLIEPFLPTRLQAYVWSGAFVAFALLCAATAFTAVRTARPAATPPAEVEAAERPTPGTRALWLLLPACASTLLLAVTNHLSQDVAAIPFLWILPLSLYLLTFILAFDAEGWYRRPVFLALLVPSLAGMAYLLWPNAKELDMKWLISIFSAAFFVACMFCHGELARLKPHPRRLTGYYLMISLGGAAGGLFVGLLAPVAFPSYFEFPLGLGLCGILGAWVLQRGRKYSMELWSLVAVFLVFIGLVIRDSVSGYRYAGRNFYGALRVRQTGEPPAEDAYRTLLHGSINHGEQWLDPQKRRQAQTYYCKDSGVGQALALRSNQGPRRLGVVGLGTGTLAAYGRPGDTVRYYEINPLVVDIARQWFTYLGDTQAKLDIVLGDARQAMEREGPQNYDVLAVDAFSGDSIPVHLLTREAIQLYFRHLKPDGILAVHVSNKFLDLIPVVGLSAGELKKAATAVDTEDSDDGNCFGATWVLVANEPGYLANLPFHNGTALATRAGLRTWTDDYSNLFRILK
ncbi:MAG: fused MFS/spermidine synthase [Bryobacteraceae bacterium]|nr:fused MFS/spermidine synthase [Bryobacteraceae bacterium]